MTSDSFIKVATNYPGGLMQARINEHLKTVFQVSKMSPAEKTILRFAALLHDSGLDPELFAVAAIMEKRSFVCKLFGIRKEADHLDTPQKVLDVLQNLADRGWLEYTNDLLRIHPVIRLVCQEELPLTNRNCTMFLDVVWERYRTCQYGTSKCLQIAMMFAEADRSVKGLDKTWYNRALDIIWEVTEGQCAQGNYGAAYESTMKALDISKHKQDISYSSIDNVDSIDQDTVMTIWNTIKMPRAFNHTEGYSDE